MDSSALLAIAASNGHDLKAFTIGFPDAEADEEPYARMVWERYKDRVDLTVSDMRVEKLFHGGDSADGALAAVNGMGEPFHSPSMLANQQIWRDMRRRGIRVSINGGAGDELLAGYSGVHFQPYLWDLLRSGRFGRYHREAVSCSEAPTAAFSQAYFGRLLRVARFGLQTSFLHQAASNARVRQRAIDAGLDPGMAPDLRRPLALERLLVEQMGDRQMNYWLRSGHQSHMSIPIEVRAPFLDHRVVEHAFLLPTRYLIRDGWLKWILRHATRDLLPAEILWRANKAGFPFPFASWLRDSKRPFLAIAKGSGAASMAGIDLRRLEARYDELIQVDPHMLWRLMSVCLWWQRCARASTASNECS
jgi:asparagine synthase (glutamine-hydrolysing)